MYSQLKTYIIHVKTDVERERYMLSQLDGRDLDIEFVLEGDIPDLDLDILSGYFEGDQLAVVPSTSCGFKHFKCCEYMVRERVPYALILEDDIYLYSNWDILLPRVWAEIERRGLNGFVVSLEESNLHYPKGSERKHGQLLYQKNAGRTTGAYLVDLAYAEGFLEYLQEHKCDRPIGHFVNRACRDGVFEIYWLHPPVAVQGTAMGTMPTTISRNKTGISARTSWALQRTYKRLLYRLR